jgi:D-3-phosphoglycerate dehydrogenase
MAEPPRIHILSSDRPDLEAAVREGGGELAPLERADGLVSLTGDPSELPELPESVRWVQLPSAGVEQWVRAGVVRDGRTWTSATGSFGLPVAEHALALMLAADKALHSFARERSWTGEGRHHVRALEGETVLIVGAGGIGRALIGLLEPFGARVIAVTRRGREIPGPARPARTLPVERVGEAWGEARHVVIAAPATDGTRHLVGARELAAMREDAWLVNVARGSLVDTDALVEALRTGTIAGAALDVTDPEPLPDGHPLWELDNVLITPHVATPPEAERRHFAARVKENVRRLAAGEELEGLIDPDGGY